MRCLLLLVVVAACGTPMPKDEFEQNPLIPEAEQLLGGWWSKEVRGMDGDLAYTFAADGTYTGAVLREGGRVRLEGRWSLSNGQLTLDEETKFAARLLGEELELVAPHAYALLERNDPRRLHD
ncbi:MAG: hypothetical protein ACYTGN_07040 [Planctomycetota bacterium]|jgi:hypothetical protein